MPLIANPSGGNSAAKPLTPVKAPAAPKPSAGVKAAGGLVQKAAASITTPSAAAGTGGSSTAPYMDATALANLASYINKTGSTVSNDQSGITNYQTQLANTTATDQQNNQLANLKLMTDDNAKGGFYGSGYGQQLANQNTAYGTKEADSTSTANLNIAKLTNAISELQASEPIYASQQAADAATRATTLAAKDAPASTTAPTASTTPTPSLAQKVAAAQGKANAKQIKQTGTPFGGLRA